MSQREGGSRPDFGTEYAENNIDMSMDPFVWVANAIIGWLVAVALGIVGYLVVLQMREVRRNRTMDERREQLGLRRVCTSFTSWLF